MKDFRKLRTFAAGAAVFAAISMFSVAKADDGKAIVRKLVGTAKYSTGAGGWLPIKLNDHLSTGATIQVDAESQVDFFLGVNGPTLRVTADTTVALDNLSFQGGGEDVVIETKLNLSDGRILGSVKKLAAASKYEVKTPTGVAGIRGSEYDISTKKNAAGKYESTYLCITGQIVGVDGGTSFDIADGKGFSGVLVFVIPAADLAILKGILQQIIDNTGPTVVIVVLPPPPPIIHISPVVGGKVVLTGGTAGTGPAGP